VLCGVTEVAENVHFCTNKISILIHQSTPPPCNLEKKALKGETKIIFEVARLSVNHVQDLKQVYLAANLDNQISSKET